MHDGKLMVHGKNVEYTAKPASHAALVSFILRISLDSLRAALIEPSPSTIEAMTALATAPLFMSLGLGLVHDTRRALHQRGASRRQRKTVLRHARCGIPTHSWLSPGAHASAPLRSLLRRARAMPRRL